MFGRKQTLTLLVLLIGLLSLTLLATNLIASGWVPSADGYIPTPPFPDLSSNFKFPLVPFTITPDKWYNTVLTILLIMGVISLFMLWRYPRLRKLLLFYIGLILLINYFLIPNVVPPLPEETVAEPVGELMPIPPVRPAQDAPLVDVSDPPNWFGTIVALVSALLVVALAAFLIHRHNAKRPVPLAVEIAQDAEAAIVEIEHGYDLRGAIIGAYAQMTETVQRHRGIVRSRAVTASEFAEVLQRAGLPLSPVERLTRLFEQVRYSPDKPGVRDQREAVSCLGEIVTAAERIREGG